MTISLDDASLALVQKLRERRLKIVFAESCTGGLVSASMAAISGVSDCLCGSAVTYLNEVKEQWLGVDPRLIQLKTAVCEEVAEMMATGVLSRTPDADIAASITGHLGPDAPKQLDGVVFLGFACRTESRITVNVRKVALNTSERRLRQVEAAVELLVFSGNELAKMERRMQNN